MKDYQERVITEKIELDGRIVSLTSFLHSEKPATIDTAERKRMTHQLFLMMELSRALADRIYNFV